MAFRRTPHRWAIALPRRRAQLPALPSTADVWLSSHSLSWLATPGDASRNATENGWARRAVLWPQSNQPLGLLVMVTGVVVIPAAALKRMPKDARAARAGDGSPAAEKGKLSSIESNPSKGRGSGG